MSEVVYDEWMSDGDALMWHIERDPLLRSTVTSVWVLDRKPEAKALDQLVEESIAANPRLRQRVTEVGGGIAPPRWEEDPRFDRTHHLRRVALPGGGSLRALLDFAAPIAAHAFDRDRPLWELYLVEGLEDGRTGAILKLHHSVADGMGLVRMTESLIQRTRDGADAGRRRPPLPDVPPAPGSDWERLTDAVRHRSEIARERGRGLLGAVGKAAGDLLRDPRGAVSRGAALVGSLGRLLEPAGKPLSPLWTNRSLAVHFGTLTLPVEGLKRAGRAADGTVNDAFVTIVAGALGRYHAALGHPTPALRMNMPINLRQGERAKRAGNDFVPARFLVPIDIADPLERMLRIQALVRGQRGEPAMAFVPQVNVAISRLGTSASTWVAGSLMKGVDFVTSNVPGPRHPVFMAGAQILNMFPFGPLAGAAVNVTLFSYAGECQVGVNTDPSAVTQPERLLDALQAEAIEVLALGG